MSEPIPTPEEMQLQTSEHIPPQKEHFLYSRMMNEPNIEAMPSGVLPATEKTEDVKTVFITVEAGFGVLHYHKKRQAENIIVWVQKKNISEENN